MTITTIRQRLISYLEEAEDNTVKAVYTLLEKDITEESISLSEEQWDIIKKEHALYLSGQSKSYNKAEALSFIKTGKVSDV